MSHWVASDINFQNNTTTSYNTYYVPTTKYLYTRRVYTILLESYYNKLFSYLIKLKVDDATRSSDRSTIMGNMRRSDILEKNLILER